MASRHKTQLTQRYTQGKNPMLKTPRTRYLSGLLVAVITLFAITACSKASLVKEESGISIERVDSKIASINRTYLTRADNQLLLRGEVKRRFPGRGAILGYLNITLIDPQGKTIKDADIGYKRRSVKSSFATFSARLPVELAPGSTVRITHFAPVTNNTFSEEIMWRDGNQ